MSRKHVVVIEGEDAAPEAMRPTVELLRGLVPAIEWSQPPIGDAGLEQHGSLFPEEARRAIDDSDATFFGATSGKSGAAIVYLRWGRSTYANVRPARWFPGCQSPLANPQAIDFVIVRENLEDLYLGIEGDLEELRSVKLESRLAGPPARRRTRALAESSRRSLSACEGQPVLASAFRSGDRG